MLKGKNAIITGSTSGIGLAIAEALASNGANILFNGIGDMEAINSIVRQTSKKFQVKTEFSGADMKKPEQIRQMVQDCVSKLGSVDIVVNNAGIQFTSRIEDFPEDKWDDIIAINLSSAFHAIKAALPYMYKQKFGRIINIASVHGIVASVNKSAYVAAKHGINGLTKTIALEAADSGVTANSICPGWVYTPLVHKQVEDIAKKEGISIEEAKIKLLEEKQPNKRFVRPEDIGAMAAFLSGPNGDAMTGEIISIDGGWSAR
ncbi:MAG: 3-hydroxybutyrate dehydrogenase [Rickettsiaceae bacterium]|nr:3-hydroxybutyrate dehydrogenase [Rickettsiaceae bacterium]